LSSYWQVIKVAIVTSPLSMTKFRLNFHPRFYLDYSDLEKTFKIIQ